jgi:acylphosphatase
MPPAKFHIIGDSSPWIRTRVQEEINHLQLSGTTIAAGKKTIAVIVEGDKERIVELKENLRRHSPEHLLYTRIEYGEEQTVEELKLEDDLKTTLKKVQERLDEINIKLDAIMENRTTKTALDSKENPVSDFFTL